MTIAIIGAGAAGMMAAATIQELQPEAKVILIEKNTILGRKVLISGGGRCNVTTGIHNVRELLTRYPRGRKFLTTAMYHFSPEQVYAWFEEHGVPLKTEKDLRVFPQSNNGHDVVGVFERLFHSGNVEVMAGETVALISKRDHQFQLTLQSGKNIGVDRLILTTGGQTHRHTGSTGEGYRFAESLGHTITPLAPSLNSFLTREAWPKSLAGVSFAQVGLSVAHTANYHWTGPMLFTHHGLTGPGVFALSSQIAFEQYDRATPLALELDFFPDHTAEQMRQKLQQDIHTNPKALLKTIVHYWLPKSVVEVMLQELQIPLDQINATVSKVQQQKIVRWCKQCVVQVIGRGAGEEFVTAGGVDTSEVDPRTMQSKICPGLFFAGEILNIDGYTGGFNLQAAWATGRLAGKSAILGRFSNFFAVL